MSEGHNPHRGENELADLQQSTLWRKREAKPAFDETLTSGNSGRVVLFIVTLALVFIAIISYFVTQMPRKP